MIRFLPLLLLAGCISAQIRVNVGGPQYTDTNGNVWAADTGCTSTSTYSYQGNVVGTADPTLYKTGRIDPSTLSCTYTLPATPAYYLVTLKFAETDPKVTAATTGPSANPRLMNVYINGALQVQNLNVRALAGFATAYDWGSGSLPVSSTITITITQTHYQPMLAALEIDTISSQNIPATQITYTAPGASASEPLQLKLQQVADVISYGAKGDGVTDDTAAIRSATTAICANSTGTLYFPANHTYIITPPSTPVPILNSCSGITVDIEGMLKPKNSGGSFFSIWGTPGVPLSNFTLTGYGLINLNSSNNPVPNSGDLSTYPRIVLHTGGGSNDVVENVHITDVRSVWVLFMSGAKPRVSNVLIDNVGGGSVAADSSLIYIEHDSEGFMVQGNRCVASARAANMAVTCIEHHSKGLASGNQCIDMETCIIVAEDSSTINGVKDVGNFATGALIGMQVYSSNSFGASGFGINGGDIGSNTFIIDQLSYPASGISGQGIIIIASNNLPVEDLKFHDNFLLFDLSTSNTDPVNVTDFAEGYWDASGTGGCIRCEWSGETIVNAPAVGLRYSSTTSGDAAITISNMNIVNPGSTLNTLASVWRAGIFLSGTSMISGLTVKGAVVRDTLATARFGYGVYLATVNTNSIFVDAEVQCADATCTSLQQAVEPNTTTQVPYLTARVNVPAAKVLATAALAPNSAIASMQEGIQYTWDGTQYTNVVPHDGTPVVDSGHPGSCGSGPVIVGNDRVGRILMGSGTITSCWLAWSTAFTTTNPTVVTDLQSSVGGPTKTSISTSTTGLVISGTNLAGNIVTWIVGPGQN